MPQVKLETGNDESFQENIQYVISDENVAENHTQFMFHVHVTTTM